MSSDLTLLAKYIEELRLGEEARRHSRVGMSTMSTEAGLSGNMVWRIVRQGHVPKPDTLNALASWAGDGDKAEVERIYREMMALAGHGAPGPALSDGQTRLLELVGELDEKNLSRFIEMLERFTPNGLTELMSGADTGDWPPVLNMLLSPAERKVLRVYRELPPGERDGAVMRMQSMAGDSAAPDPSRFFQLVMGMSETERSELLRHVLLDSMGIDSTEDSSRVQPTAM